MTPNAITVKFHKYLSLYQWHYKFYSKTLGLLMSELGLGVTCPKEYHDAALQGGPELALVLAYCFLIRPQTVEAAVWKCIGHNGGHKDFQQLFAPATQFSLQILLGLKPSTLQQEYPCMFVLLKSLKILWQQIWTSIIITHEENVQHCNSVLFKKNTINMWISL
jgi:hypothetical protein